MQPWKAVSNHGKRMNVEFDDIFTSCLYYLPVV